MRAALPRGPCDLEEVEAALVADLGADAVGRLRHGVTVEGQLVVRLDVDVEAAVILVPRVLELNVPRHARHIHQHLQARGHRGLVGGDRVVHVGRAAVVAVGAAVAGALAVAGSAVLCDDEKKEMLRSGL